MTKNIAMKSWLLLFISSISISLYSQSYQDSGTTLTGVWDGQSVFGDLDNDGDLDLLVSGTENIVLTYATRIYINDGNGNFTQAATHLPGVEDGSIDLHDVDHDGLIDILLVGAVDDAVNKGTWLYKNKGAFVFELVATDLPDLNSGMGKFGDYDNDGDADILLVGSDLSNNYHDIYENVNGVFVPLGLHVPKFASAMASWCDYDQDLDLDYIVSGVGSTSIILYKNEGDENFTPITINQDLIFNGSIEWGDYNSDGRSDILMLGRDSEGTELLQVFENKGSDVFEKNTSTFDGVSTGNAVWGDVDNDGDLDIFTTGYKSIPDEAVTCVYLNTNGVFTKQIATFPDVQFAHVALGDADNDLDLDLVITGSLKGTGVINPKSFLFTNTTTTANTKPTAPAGLTQLVDGQQITLSWGAGSDTETSSAGLTYNFYVGTVSNTDNISSASAGINNGNRRIVKAGNADHNHSDIVDNLAPGTYFWSVQSIDGSYIGSPFAAENTFTILNLPPVIDNFSPLSAQAGDTIIIKGENFRNTTSVTVNDGAAVFKVLNSKTIRVIVPDADITGNIEVTTSAGTVVSAQPFCKIPDQPILMAGNTSVCPGIESYGVTAIAGVSYHWTVAGDGIITEDNNDNVKIDWNSGGNFVIKITPESCAMGPELLVNVDVKGPSQKQISGSINAKTETVEQYRITPTAGELYLWSVASGGYIPQSPSHIAGVKWLQPGTHIVKVLSSNDECPASPIEASLTVNVTLNDFSRKLVASIGNIKTTIPADFDHDADIDFVSTDGKLYENNGDQTFTPKPIILTEIGNIKVGDFDNDNDADLVVSTEGKLQVFENQGGLNFALAWKSTEPYSASEVNFIDYNNDGKLDVFIIGNRSLSVYENLGAKNFERTITLDGFMAVQFQGKSTVLDFNNDGYDDITTSNGGVFINQGGKSFALQPIDYLADYFAQFAAQFPTLSTKEITWEDYDNDGNLDLFEHQDGTLNIHRNTGATYTKVYTTTLNFISSLDFIDLNNDGLKDMIIGSDSSQVQYYNSTTQSFGPPVQKFDYRGLATTFDFDMDGSNDLIFSESNPSQFGDSLTFFISNLVAGPSASSLNSFASAVIGPDVTISWQSNATPKSFNVIVGDAVGSPSIVSPLAVVASGFRDVVAPGNAGKNAFFKISNLPPGTYHWSVQEIDSRLMGSAFSPSQSFTINASALIPPDNLTLRKEEDGLVLGWTDNSPDELGFIIERSEDNINFTEIGDEASGVQSFEDANITEGVTYFYRVKAYHATGESYYSEVISSEDAIIASFPHRESFENEKYTWKKIPNDDVGTGFVENALSRRKMVFGGADGDYAMSVDLNSFGPSEGRIESPMFDLSSLSNAQMTVSMKTLTFQTDQMELRIFASSDNGATWQTLSHYTYTSTGSEWKPIWLDLNNFKTQPVKFRIFAKLVNTGFPAPQFYLDRIVISNAPSAPQNIAIAQTSDNSLKVTWDAASGATHYVIERKENNGGYHAVDTVAINSFDDVGLTMGMTYSYLVYAVDLTIPSLSPYSSGVNLYLDAPPAVETPDDLEILVTDAISLDFDVDDELPADELTITVTSDNEDVIPTNTIVVEVVSDDEINIKTNPNAPGLAVISLSVSDGRFTVTKTFTITVLPVNIAPVITAQNAAYSMDEDLIFDLLLSQLKVTDPDNTYPNGFHILAGEGAHYFVVDTKIIPDENYFGELIIPVRVNDGMDNSPVFEFHLKVNPINDPPLITGTTKDFIIASGAGLKINITDFIVEDPDNTFPTDHTLSVFTGENYTVFQNTVRVNEGFAGTLDVPVSINDGIESGPLFTIEVNADDILGAEDAIMNSTSISPNPNTGRFTVSVPVSSGEKINMRIIDHLGKEIARREERYLAPAEMNLNIAPGVYFMEVNSLKGSVVKKFMVK